MKMNIVIDYEKIEPRAWDETKEWIKTWVKKLRGVSVIAIGKEEDTKGVKREVRNEK